MSMDQKLQDKLLTKAKQCHSDSFLVWQNGDTIAEYYSASESEPIHLRSITKSIAGLAIGFLVDLGKIQSIDEPVWHLFPQWDNEQYRQITIKHIMTHTSGLATIQPPRLLETSIPNIIEAALQAATPKNPGSVFVYNNLAVNLISGIVSNTTGETMLQFLSQRLFQPLDIDRVAWNSDPQGNNYAFAGLQMNACDLSKIGQLILNNGEWKGKRILSENWITQATRRRQSRIVNSGLLWWLFPNDLQQPVNYINSNGDFGQWLIVDFVKRIVAVRQIQEGSYRGDEDGYWNLFALIMDGKC